MLVLARKLHQQVVIGDNVVLTIVEIRRDGTVRLGISAPPEVAVHRLEVVRRIQEERRLNGGAS